MGRKVFISILGSNDYNECKYDSKKDNYESENVRFVQEATLDFWNAKQWPSDSIAYIFTTTTGKRGSYKCNWLDNGHRDRETKEIVQCEGLATRLQKMNLPFPVEQINIKDGVDEDEIWEIFQVIYDLLSEGDEVYFDITHGFRYIPMLVLPLLNYSKFLKNTTTKNISYGNFEGRDENNISPIVNLTSFSALQDWTKAGSDFISFGVTDGITSILSDTDNYSEDDLFVFEKFSKEISTCRGKDIISAKSALKLTSILSRENNENKVFEPIKEVIKEKISPYKENDVNNGYRAVEYCLKHGLIQQGFTILQEFIITTIIDILSSEDVYDIKMRDVVSSCLSVKVKAKFTFDYSIKDFDATNPVFDKYVLCKDSCYDLEYKTKLTKIYNSISHGARNDLNHAGFNENPKEMDEFAKGLNEKLNKVKQILSYVTEPVESH